MKSFRGDLQEPPARARNTYRTVSEETGKRRPIHWPTLGKKLGSTALFAVLLVAAGSIILGLAGVKAPHVSGEVIQTQWEKLTRQEVTLDELNELEKNP